MSTLQYPLLFLMDIFVEKVWNIFYFTLKRASLYWLGAFVCASVIKEDAVYACILLDQFLGTLPLLYKSVRYQIKLQREWHVKIACEPMWQIYKLVATQTPFIY